jgi:hypothetical protein
VTIEASTSAALSGEADERSTWRALLSRLGSPDVLLLAGGLVLPNLLSLATLISLLDIGLPPRTGAILLYASLAILARRIPFALTAALFLCLLAFDMVQTLSLMFGLAPTEMMAALDEARRIHARDDVRGVGVPEPAQRAGAWPRRRPVRAGVGLRRARLCQQRLASLQLRLGIRPRQAG